MTAEKFFANKHQKNFNDFIMLKLILGPVKTKLLFCAWRRKKKSKYPYAFNQN